MLDTSHEVAALVFNAAIDEFKHPTHRRLAQETLGEVGAYVGASMLQLKRRLPVHDKITSNYDNENLFRAIGFHLGSELFADQEFNTLDARLKEKYPNLVAHLKRNYAYTWIAIHTTVEKNHFANALGAANAALKYQVGNRYDKSDILEGFHTFGKVQQDFMRSLIL